MLLRKHVGGCSVGGHEWTADGDVVEVPDQLGADLLAIAPDDYEHLVAKDPAGEPGDESSVAGELTGELPGESEPAGDEVRKPNQAASAADWQAYALAQGLDEDTVNDASRKAIVEHFNGGPSLTGE